MKPALPSTGALSGDRYRVIVSTDIGGSDPDDYQSMVHYLLYCDLFDTEGLLSSPFGDGRVKDILHVIDQYEKDYPTLKTHSEHYPTPDALRAMTKQGAADVAPYSGYSAPTEASDWIIRCAKKDDPRPLYILVWGLLEDVAQALHDAPEIADTLRIYYIGGPNKKWGPDAYAYLYRRFPHLWMIENNSAYRGWFIGGNQSDDLGNASFVRSHAAGHGALGDYFATLLGGVIKMGDTPSVSYLLRGDPENPQAPSWGGHFAKVGDMPTKVFTGHPTLHDETEVFSLVEFIFPGPVLHSPDDAPVFTMQIGGQSLNGYSTGRGEYRVRFVPREAGAWTYTLKSSLPELDGQSGAFRCVEERAETRAPDRYHFSAWWSDRLDADLADGIHKGTKTVNTWREAYLHDFAARFDRCCAKRPLDECRI